MPFIIDGSSEEEVDSSADNNEGPILNFGNDDSSDDTESDGKDQQDGRQLPPATGRPNTPRTQAALMLREFNRLHRRNSLPRVIHRSSGTQQQSGGGAQQLNGPHGQNGEGTGHRRNGEGGSNHQNGVGDRSAALLALLAGPMPVPGEPLILQRPPYPLMAGNAHQQNPGHPELQANNGPNSLPDGYTPQIPYGFNYNLRSPVSRPSNIPGQRSGARDMPAPLAAYSPYVSRAPGGERQQPAWLHPPLRYEQPAWLHPPLQYEQQQPEGLQLLPMAIPRPPPGFKQQYPARLQPEGLQLPPMAIPRPPPGFEQQYPARLQPFPDFQQQQPETPRPSPGFQQQQPATPRPSPSSDQQQPATTRPSPSSDQQQLPVFEPREAGPSGPDNSLPPVVSWRRRTPLVSARPWPHSAPVEVTHYGNEGNEPLRQQDHRESEENDSIVSEQDRDSEKDEAVVEIHENDEDDPIVPGESYESGNDVILDLAENARSDTQQTIHRSEDDTGSVGNPVATIVNPQDIIASGSGVRPNEAGDSHTENHGRSSARDGGSIENEKDNGERSPSILVRIGGDGATGSNRDGNGNDASEHDSINNNAADAGDDGAGLDADGNTGNDADGNTLDSEHGNTEEQVEPADRSSSSSVPFRTQGET